MGLGASHRVRRPQCLHHATVDADTVRVELDRVQQRVLVRDVRVSFLCVHTQPMRVRATT